MNDTLLLWEEKNSTELLTKLESKPTFVLNNGINEIKPEYVRSECDDIGNKNKWIRKCPNCLNPQYYTTYRGFYRATKDNRMCLSCNTTRNKRDKNNYIGIKFGKLTITNQYYLEKGNLKVDYICDCGNKTINKSFAKVKIQKMCLKCCKTNQHKMLENGKASFNSVYFTYIKRAKNKLLDFQLTEEEFRTLTKQDCFYCGSKPNTQSRPDAISGVYIYNGVDRKDSSKGYTLENSVSCCKLCNIAKWDLPINDFLSHIKKVYDYQHLRGKL